jgi:hypothetical protein
MYLEFPEVRQVARSRPLQVAVANLQLLNCFLPTPTCMTSSNKSDQILSIADVVFANVERNRSTAHSSEFLCPLDLPVYWHFEHEQCLDLFRLFRSACRH